MRKLITITALTILTFGAFAQAKKDTAKYEYFIKVPVRDYQQLTGIAGDYSKQVKYNSLINDKDARTIQINIEKYLFDLPKSVKIDSVLIKK